MHRKDETPAERNLRLFHVTGTYGDGGTVCSNFSVHPVGTTRNYLLKHVPQKRRKHWTVRMISDDYRIAEIYKAMCALLGETHFELFVQTIHLQELWQETS